MGEFSKILKDLDQRDVKVVLEKSFQGRNTGHGSALGLRLLLRGRKPEAIGNQKSKNKCPLTGSNDRPCHYASDGLHLSTSDTHYHCAKRACEAGIKINPQLIQLNSRYIRKSPRPSKPNSGESTDLINPSSLWRDPRGWVCLTVITTGRPI